MTKDEYTVAHYGMLIHHELEEEFTNTSLESYVSRSEKALDNSDA